MIYLGPIFYGGISPAEMFHYDTSYSSYSEEYYRMDLGKVFGGGFKMYYSWPLGFQLGFTFRYDVMLLRWDYKSVVGGYIDEVYTHIDISSIFIEPFASMEIALGRVLIRTSIGVPVVSSRAKYEDEKKNTYQLNSPTVLGFSPAISLRFPIGRVVPYISLAYPIVSTKNYKGKDEKGNDIFLGKGLVLLTECSIDCKKFDLSGPRLGLGIDVRVW